MSSLRELMAEVFPENPGLNKTASAASKPSSTSEVDRVLNDLGLLDAESVKTASATTDESENNGGSMSSLAEIYERTMSAPTATKTAAAAPAAAVVEKTASEADASGISDFGSLVGGYFNEQFMPYVEKVAADLETEAGKDESPVAHAPGGGGMTAVIGKEGDPHMHVNHKPSDGSALKVTTQGHSPYSLAVKQSILKRFSGQGIVGEQK